MLSFEDRKTPLAKYWVLGKSKSASIIEVIRENLREKSIQSLCLFYTLRESKESLRRCAAARDNRYASRNTALLKYALLRRAKYAFGEILVSRKIKNSVNHRGNPRKSAGKINSITLPLLFFAGVKRIAAPPRENLCTFKITQTSPQSTGYKSPLLPCQLPGSAEKLSWFLFAQAPY